MTPLIFGSDEANDQLYRETGRRYDLGGVDPFTPRARDDDNPYDDSAPRGLPTCTICGCSMEWVDCWQCGGKGGRDGDDLMEEDPLWYDEDDWEDCDICEGKGGYYECINVPHDQAETEPTP